MCTNHESNNMIPSSGETDFPTKQESTARVSSSSTATPWLKSKDPRIVRVSRALGTKDRHSKVCTVRGLRDRRVRLSVPTAIQLYDLQDRLGLNQPSKVFDWLINAAKDEIDELPPLQMPPLGSMIANHHHSFLPSGASSSRSIWDDRTVGDLPNLNLWNNNNNNNNNSSTFSRSKSKEIEMDINEDQEKQGNDNSNTQLASSSNDIFSRNNQNYSLMMNNNIMPYGSSYQLEPSNFTPHLQINDQNFNVFLCPHEASTAAAAITQTYFPSSSTEFDPRQAFHISSSSSNSPLPFSLGQAMGPFQFNMKDRDSRNDDGSRNRGT